MQLFSESDEDEEREYEVEKILDRKFLPDGFTYYLVQWKNYKEATWQQKSDLINCYKLLVEFRKQHLPALVVKDMQKQLPLPKFTQQPQDYYRKVQLWPRLSDAAFSSLFLFL